ncbi:MAG: hypothetical protein Q4C95_01175 [Planctomycetia bacterium]|nr:hypothetical protein [Planctomycetia bacterium]
MRRLLKISLVFQLAILISGMTLSQTFAQNVSTNPSYTLGGGMNISSGSYYIDNDGYDASFSMFANDNCYSDCGDPCLDACNVNCIDPCYSDCGYNSNGVFPLISDIANVALTPVHWVANLLTFGTYPDCGCAPKPKRAYCDPCDGCGNWVGCDYCGGQGCSSCSGAFDYNNGINYAGDQIMTSDFENGAIENQQISAPQDQLQNYEEIPSNVINDRNSTTKINRRVPQQVAMRTRQNIPQNQFKKQNSVPQTVQSQMINVPAGSSQNIQQVPQQMQPIPSQTKVMPVNKAKAMQSARSPVQQGLQITDNMDNHPILVLPNLEQSNQISQTMNNQPTIRIYKQQIPVQQRNQIVQVASQPQMNELFNKIRPVNYNDSGKMNQKINIRQPNMIVSKQIMVPANNNGNAQTANGTVQMIVVPNNNVQQPVTKVYVQQPLTLPTTNVQQASKLNQTYGK